MRSQLVIANWKMHGSKQQAEEFLSAFAPLLSEPKCDVVICPSDVFISQVADKIQGLGIEVAVGGQNICPQEQNQGAYTGETSAAMLQGLGANYVLVGHSERRAYYGETDADTAAKCQIALSSELTPVLCVGETLEQREAGETLSLVAQQLAAVFEVLKANMVKLVIAYEPVWAIGTGKTATPEQAQEVHAFIRQWLAENIGAQAQDMSVLYGGSVKQANAKDLFAMSDIDGALVGGASLIADEFAGIIKAAQ